MSEEISGTLARDKRNRDAKPLHSHSRDRGREG